jgi:outer membrane usher protein
MPRINPRYPYWVALVLCVYGVFLASVAPAMAQPSPSSAPMVFEFPLWVDGRNVGDLTASVQDKTLIDVQRDRLLTLLAPLLKTDALAPLRDKTSVTITAKDLSAAGLPLRYLPDEVRLDLQTPPEKRLPKDLSLGYVDDSEGADFVQPSDFSAIINSSVRSEYVHKQPSGDDDTFNPLNSVFNVRANAFGVSGLNLDSDIFFKDEDDRSWNRGQSTLFHDDVDTAVRYSAGDLNYATSDSLQGFRNIGGLSIERRYSEIQPSRMIRSTGRGEFTLDQTSVVDVIVNGVTVRTVRLDPGRYNLRDLPFVDGLNDIELRIRDQQGRETTMRFSSFGDTVLLDEGISEFSLNFGAASDIQDDNEPEYDESNPTYSSFYRRGMTDNLTLGTSAQGDTNINTQGVNAGLATLWGTFGASYALSHSSIADTGTGTAMTLDYKLERPDPWLEDQRQEFDFSYLETSSDFSTLDDAQSDTGPSNTTKNEWRARFRQPLSDTASLGLGGSYAVGRDTDDTFAANVSLSETITPKLTGYINVEYGTRSTTSNEDTETEGRVFATLTYKFDSPNGRSRTASSRYSSPNRAGSLEWQDLANDRNRVGSYDFTAGANTSESDEAATADFGYTGNRYLLQADHEARSDQNDSGITEQVSGVTFQSAVAYSGGQMAVGRPSNGAFAIVAPHKTLTNNKIAVDVNENNLPLATTDVFGPALVPNLRTYSPSRLPVQIDDLPTGYDLGSGRYDLNPGARTGYDLQVGSANSVVIIGRLVRPDGTPYTLASGIITPEEGQPTSFFTNRSGRFVGEKLAPGKHTLTLYTDPPLSTTFVIPEDAVGRVELGNLIPMP